MKFLLKQITLKGWAKKKGKIYFAWTGTMVTGLDFNYTNKYEFKENLILERYFIKTEITLCINVGCG